MFKLQTSVNKNREIGCSKFLNAMYKNMLSSLCQGICLKTKNQSFFQTKAAK